MLNCSSFWILGWLQIAQIMENSTICKMNVLILLLFIKCLYGAEDDQKTLLDNDIPEIERLNSTPSTGMYFLIIAS